MDIKQLMLESIRRRRNILLKESDWTQLTDVALSDQEKLAWQQYRKQLRDIPQTLDIENMNHWDEAVESSVFPKKPN